MSPQRADLIFYAAIIGLVTVALGAFGAHALKDILDEAGKHRFDLASRYAFIHALAIMAAALALPLAAKPQRLLLAAWLFIAGIVLFSGSLVILALTGIRFFAVVTPLGGLCFLVGWGFFAFGMRGK